MNKDSSIIEVMAKLKDQSTNEIEVIDHWDADLCAIGFWNGREKERIAYVSTYNMEDGKYFLSLEFPEQEGSDESSEDIDYHDIDFSELLDRFTNHLSMNYLNYHK